jgi:hypothetical protein
MAPLIAAVAASFFTFIAVSFLMANGAVLRQCF